MIGITTHLAHWYMAVADDTVSTLAAKSPLAPASDLLCDTVGIMMLSSVSCNAAATLTLLNLLSLRTSWTSFIFVSSQMGLPSNRGACGTAAARRQQQQACCHNLCIVRSLAIVNMTPQTLCCS